LKDHKLRKGKLMKAKRAVAIASLFAILTGVTGTAAVAALYGPGGKANGGLVWITQTKTAYMNEYMHYGMQHKAGVKSKTTGNKISWNGCKNPNRFSSISTPPTGTLGWDAKFC
jgi:hypothetical protein